MQRTFRKALCSVRPGGFLSLSPINPTVEHGETQQVDLPDDLSSIPQEHSADGESQLTLADFEHLLSGRGSHTHTKYCDLSFEKGCVFFFF